MGRLGSIVLLVVGVFAVAAAVAVAHPEPGDIDGDGVRDEVDNCAQTRNADQLDTDHDGPGDRCDADADNDTVPNSLPYLDRGDDNCPTVPNPGQEPSSDPRFGAACYRDSDGDGEPDPLDNCPAVANSGQADYDYDRTGDVCDPDDDDDGDFDAADNCQFTYNWDQADADGDGRGTACDDDESGARGGGSGGGGGGSGGGDANANDSTAPTLRLTVGRTQRLGELGAGMAVRVRCSEGCALEARLTVTRATARRLHVARTVAQGAAALGDEGTTYVFVRFKRGATSRLARGSGVKAQLTLTAADESGNRRSVGRDLRLRR
jgi:uncharacterized membrane protein YgcG